MTADSGRHGTGTRAAPAYDRLVLISMRMGNHAGPSGYDRLISANLPASVIAVARPKTPGERLLSRVLRPLARRSGALWYHRDSALAEARAAWHWCRDDRAVFHYLYGENSFRYLPAMTRLLRRRHRIVATFHTPEHRLKEVVTRREHLKALDGVIVMSTAQIPYFAAEIGEQRVFFVPHGVDTGYFRPANGAPDAAPPPPRVLTVGHHLRDFELLRAVAERVGKVVPEVEFAVVANPERAAVLAGQPNVRLYARLSDDALRSLYRESRLLFMPLRDATANNALLEAMACGLPLVASDIQGVRDYVSGACSVLHDNEPDAFARTIERLLGDPGRRAELAAASRAQAETLDWDVIRRRTLSVYDAVVATD